MRPSPPPPFRETKNGKSLEKEEEEKKRDNPKK